MLDILTEFVLLKPDDLITVVKATSLVFTSALQRNRHMISAHALMKMKSLCESEKDEINTICIIELLALLSQLWALGGTARHSSRDQYNILKDEYDDISNIVMQAIEYFKGNFRFNTADRVISMHDEIV